VLVLSRRRPYERLAFFAAAHHGGRCRSAHAPGCVFSMPNRLVAKGAGRPARRSGRGKGALLADRSHGVAAVAPRGVCTLCKGAALGHSDRELRGFILARVSQ